MADETTSTAGQTNTDTGGTGADTAVDTTTVLTGGDASQGKTPSDADKGKTGDAGAADKGNGGDASGDTKTGEDGKTGEEGKDKTAKADEAALFDPAKLTLPEGVALDEKLMGKVAPILTELKVPQDQAQALMDAHMESMQSLADAVVQHLEGELTKQRDSWLETVRKDEVLCKPENQKLAASFLDRFGATPELKQLLTKTGLGNHPDLVRLFYNAALKIAEDNPNNGTDSTTASGEQKSIEDRLYGKKT